MRSSESSNRTIRGNNIVCSYTETRGFYFSPPPDSASMRLFWWIRFATGKGNLMSDSDYTRRGFVRLCTAAVTLLAASPALLARTDSTLRRYERARLVDDRGRAISATHLKEGENYIFHYPYVTTPCFLINLGKPAKAATLRTEDGKEYHWSGGVGPRGTIVAFAAICAHKMTHPAQQVKFINY